MSRRSATLVVAAAALVVLLASCASVSNRVRIAPNPTGTSSATPSVPRRSSAR